MNDESSNPNHGFLTRRQWLLRLGEATALLGFSGELGAALAQPSTVPSAPGNQPLPPGLYEPSTEHLAHAYRSDGTYHYIPPGAETDYVPPPAGPYRPRFFTPSDFDVVRRIAGLLLGEGGAHSIHASAGAEELGQTLAEWIDLSVLSAAGIRRAAQALKPGHRALTAAVDGEEAIRRLEGLEPEPVCREGLAWLERTAHARYQQKFMALAAAQQTEMLRSISDEKRSPGAASAGCRFFDLVKREVIRGYYTSRAGLAELDYKGNAFYAESPGCEGPS
ncbi:MAG TPA: gluconate 2-dehydrogenase subunit 3 family protein [Terriglobia bacterium]|nr:gluconate 2-dehydrogenase subunit 3 family protein [Terriglobia bacterium]